MPMIPGKHHKLGERHIIGCSSELAEAQRAQPWRGDKNLERGMLRLESDDDDLNPWIRAEILGGRVT